MLELWFNQGVELLRTGQWAEAEALYRRVLPQQMGNAAVHDSLAVALRHQGKWEEAATAVRTALVLRPNFPEAWMNLGSILRGMNKPAEAIEAHRKALELQPDLPIPWNNMGNALRTLNRLPEAIEAYEKALALRPDFAEAWSNLGACCDVQAGQGDRAFAAPWPCGRIWREPGATAWQHAEMTQLRRRSGRSPRASVAAGYPGNLV